MGVVSPSAMWVEDGTQVARLGGKCLYLLSHLSDPKELFLLHTYYFHSTTN